MYTVANSGNSQWNKPPMYSCPASTSALATSPPATSSWPTFCDWREDLVWTGRKLLPRLCLNAGLELTQDTDLCKLLGAELFPEDSWGLLVQRPSSNDLRGRHDDVNRDVVLEHLPLLDVVHELQVVDRRHHEGVLVHGPHPPHDPVLQLSKALALPDAAPVGGVHGDAPDDDEPHAEVVLQRDRRPVLPDPRRGAGERELGAGDAVPVQR
mmetsp:Transcript_29591/g.70508  ORF Transcript_29591/g.70508 Transcript_29591/m.70508 type:complete len:211 (+) Transcript_29591:136-768(+)